MRTLNMVAEDAASPQGPGFWMYTLIEFHGRLSRSDKRPANPGRYDLLFQLHPSADGNAALWSENLKGIEVAPGGFYYVTLGQKSPLSASLFAAPRWLSARVIVGGKRADEHSSRVPLLGQIVCLGELVSQIDARVQAVEGALAGLEASRRQVREGAPATKLKEWADDVAARLTTLEAQGGGLGGGQLSDLVLRLEAIDGDEGRLTHIEDELEDIVGKDGDLVDLNERMDLLEARAPELIANLRAREGETGRERLDQMDQSIRQLHLRLAEADRTLIELRAALQSLREAPPGPEAIGAVKRAGDSMTGNLTISRGGLDLTTGSLTAKAAEIASIEAANQVKTARVVTESLDLRGDLSADTGKRALQIRLIEGRQGGARRDGPLHLNTRGGAEVVIGNTEQRSGVEVLGPVSADPGAPGGGAVATLFRAEGELVAGDVVRVSESDADRVTRCKEAGDRAVIGVICERPAVLLGGPGRDGHVAVAIQGVCLVRVDTSAGPVRAGDLLMAGPTPGTAVSAPEGGAPAGAIFGKALEGTHAGRGAVRALIGSR